MCCEGGRNIDPSFERLDGDELELAFAVEARNVKQFRNGTDVSGSDINIILADARNYGTYVYVKDVALHV